MSVRWYNLAHEPISVEQAELLLIDGPARVIAQDVVIVEGEPVWVSTVFLVLDQRLFGDGPPVLYETMAFTADASDWCERWCTREAALAGHDRAVAELRAEGLHRP